jgi:hypothetical protein
MESEFVKSMIVPAVLSHTATGLHINNSSPTIASSVGFGTLLTMEIIWWKR